MSSGGNPRFGKYVLLSKLGMGGMAEVFKARVSGDPSLIVAIKRILPQFSKDQKLISMLVNEARLSMLLAHPNIVPVLDFGVVDGTYFIAMEYVPGKDLKSLIIRCKTQKKTLPLPMAVHILKEVLIGLDYAHHKTDNFNKPLQIVHRDVSPHNVLLSVWGEVRVLDFGIAKAASRAGDTQTGILKGKFSYMAPEQAHGKDVDNRIDIFSAGILLWELLTLESYYDAETDVELLSMVREGRPRDPREVNPKIPKELSRIILRALQKKPRRRYQTAGEFAEELEVFQNEYLEGVSQKDVSAFLRAYFKFPEQDLAQLKKLRRASQAKHEKSYAESSIGSAKKLNAARRKIQRENQIKVYMKQGSALVITGLVLGTLFWVFSTYSAREVFKIYDQQLQEWLTDFHMKDMDLETEGEGIQLFVRKEQESPYRVRLTPEVRQKLEELPFSQYEDISLRIEDLSNNPRISSAKRVSGKPGQWSISESSLRLTYQIRNAPNSVLVTRLEKIR